VLLTDRVGVHVCNGGRGHMADWPSLFTTPARCAWAYSV